MTIYAIIPVHNRIELTLQFLDSLDAQEIDEDVHALIIDDGSTDGTSVILQQRQGRFPVEIIKGDGNLWWAGATKRGLQSLAHRIETSDWIYLGNNDTILEPRHLYYLRESARAKLNSIVGARSFEIWPGGVLNPVSSGFRIQASRLQVEVIPGADTSVLEVDALSARGLLLPASLLHRLSLNERLAPQHLADIAMTRKLKRHGVTLLVDHRAVSTQTATAGSALKLGGRHLVSFRKQDPLYIPALLRFWAGELSSIVLQVLWPGRQCKMELRK